MNIDAHLIFTTALGLVCGVLGWLGRELWAAVQALRRDLSALEIRVSTDYVRYDRLVAALEPIKEGIHEIKAALAHKADK